MAPNNEFEQVPCAVCGNVNSQPIAEKGQYGFPARVAICRNCGLVYLNPRWTRSRYEQFYRNEYDKYYRPQVFANESPEERYRHARKIWERIEEHCPKRLASILDIGSGMGWTLDFLSTKIRGASLFAIESSQHCSDHLENRLGVNLVSKNADSDWHRQYQGQFDLVIMRHVIEHLLDPLSVLEKVHDSLSPEGLLYIGVPDMMSPKELLNEYWFRAVHTYYFSEVTLVRVCAKAHLMPLRITSEDSELWGVFKEGTVSGRVDNVYDEQIAVLERHRKKMMWPRAAAFARKQLARALPESIKRLLRSKLKRKPGRLS